MKKMILAAALVATLVGTAHAGPKHGETKKFYGETEGDFLDAPDRYAHPQSVEEYRHLVGPDLDKYGFCRNARHLDKCLRVLEGRMATP